MIWPKRSTTPRVPKSGEQEDQIAPRLVAASIATTASGRFGRKPATRSPGPMPQAASACASRETSRGELGVRDLAARAALRPGDQRRRRVAPAQQVLGEVEPRLAGTSARRACARASTQHGPVLALAQRSRRSARGSARRPPAARSRSGAARRSRRARSPPPAAAARAKAVRFAASTRSREGCQSGAVTGASADARRELRRPPLAAAPHRGCAGYRP